MKMIFVLTIFSSVTFLLANGKVYTRCELARELESVHKAPHHQLATWVCIAEHESQYKTDAVGRLGAKGTADHGIFQINDRYWCSPPGRGTACGLSCAQLEDDDITDDFECAQKIYKEHKILSGDGFNAWVVYKSHCKGSKAAKYLKDCFPKQNTTKPIGIGRPKWERIDVDVNPEKIHEKNILEKLPDKNAISQTTTTKNSFKPTVRGHIQSFSVPTTSPTFFRVTNSRSNIPSVTQPLNTASISTRNRFGHLNPTTIRPFGQATSKPNNPSRSTIQLPSTLQKQKFTIKPTVSNRPVFVINGMQWY